MRAPAACPPRSGLDRGIVGHDGDGAPSDLADSRDHTIGGEVAGERVYELTLLHESICGVEEQVEPLAHEELSLLSELLVVLRSAALLYPLAHRTEVGSGPDGLLRVAHRDGREIADDSGTNAALRSGADALRRRKPKNPRRGLARSSCATRSFSTWSATQARCDRYEICMTPILLFGRA